VFPAAEEVEVNRWILKVLFCLLVFSATAAEAAPVTFNKDIAPILYANCASCHRPGEIAPFSLLSYQDAAKRAKLIATVTARHYMPPWKPEPGFGDFAGAHRLTDDQIAHIQQWAESGAPEGDPADRIEPPKFTEGWQLGKPDLVVQMPEAFTIPADGRDIYRCFVVPLNLTEDKSVAAVEFRPGNRKVVHHSILHLEQPGADRRRDGADQRPGYNCFGGGGVGVEGGLGGWVPGQRPEFLPDGVARSLPKGSDLIIQNHYHPSGKTETDQSSVGIYFAKTPPTRIVLTLPVASRNLYIAAGDDAYKVTASFTTPIRMEITEVAPHMHLLGKEMKVTATLPDGSTRPMIWIKDWDFNWQGQYRFKEPLILPPGSRVDMEATFDNSANNPRNPNSPPKLVRWGEQTTDEMAIVFLQSVTSNPTDRVTLFTALFQQLAPFGNPRQAGGRRGGGAGAVGAGAQILMNNPDAVFRFISGNKDTITRQEFQQLFAQSQASVLAQRPEIANILFDQIDANADGVLTIAEFRKLTELLRTR
jgi:mono/diheme cytochrome c family protein